MKREMAIKLIPVLLLFFLFQPPALPQAAARPNVVFIMADDLGYGDLGCYGQEKIRTPHIDQLAAEGMRFTQAYAGSSVCAPSRSSLMAGFHNGHNRIRDNLPHGIYLRPDDFTLAELFKQAGYATGGVGKWGLGVPGSWGLPNQQGFDYWYGHINQDQAHFYYPDYLWENDELVLLQEMVMVNEVGKLKGNRGGENSFYTHDLFTDKAVQFIGQNRENPFFLYLSYTIPHFSDYPKDSPEHFIVPSDAPYTDEDWPQMAKNYAAMISRMDGDVGKIMELLKALGIDENTLVIFTSDNGPYTGVPTPIEFFNSNGPFRGGKRDLYEGGIRVPFIARWKNVIPAGTENDKVIAFWDMMPSFADLTGHPAELETDGISILPDLKGQKGKEHEFLYWDYGHVRPTFKQAIRQGPYKGISITSKEQRSFELYKLEEDPGETKNIADSHPEVVDELQKMMDQAYAPTNDYPRRSGPKASNEDDPFSQVPGVAINHKPASSGVYVGAPSITIMPNGDYVSSHNFTSIQKGDHGKVHKTAVYRSEDKGLSWEFLSEIDNQRWSTIFYHQNALYLMGVYEAFGNIAIRRSTDGGKTWTEPVDETSGLLAEGRYHCAPVPVVIHQGRIWRAMEDAPQGREFRALMMSAPVDADLLRADSWAFSNKLPYEESWYGGKMKGWLEGNAVVAPDGQIVNVLRSEFTDSTHGIAAMARVSSDGKETSFDPEDGFIRLPGGTSKKFTIRHDPKSGKYWALVNWIQPGDLRHLEQGARAGRLRNTLALASSTDLRDWIVERIVLYHPDVKKHAFQYVGWQFDGEDLIAVSRTAYDDGLGGADNYHNANFITFHRIPHFRENFNFDPPWDKN